MHGQLVILAICIAFVHTEVIYRRHKYPNMALTRRGSQYLKRDCQSNEDCGEGKYCSGNECFYDPYDRRGDVKRTDSCSTHADCGEGKYCSGNECFYDPYDKRGCESNLDCPLKHLCSPSNGQCVHVPW
ncbi:uncharacterized protein LOC142357180 [Convolutriloba macropyga]|uniref:uncharacterized protein LOC142357180 n=1 Tax=Convolutriloba macropyga TaxID=536237 RepID=UPI003F51B023